MTRIAIALLLMVGCSSLRQTHESDESTIAKSEDQRMRAKADPAWLLVYDASDFDGEEIAPVIEAHALTAFVVFNTWCDDCQKELGVLAALVQDEPRVGVVGLNFGEADGGKSDEGKLHAYVKDHAEWLRVIMAHDDLIKALGGVPKLPAIFLFDAEGKRVGTYQSSERTMPELKELQDAVQNALLPTPAPTPAPN
jgi:thiol-disulfide isomerase/thioredoxin